MMPRKIKIAAICLSTLLLITMTSCSNSNATKSTTKTTTTNTSSKTGSTESFFTTDSVHTISLDVDESTLTDMLAAYQKDGSKNWIEANVTIDGETFEKVGLKLKGNSTLKNVANQSTDEIKAEELPWVIRLDKYVDDQAYLGRTRFVVRGNNTETSLNEAVSLAMLTEAGMETEASAFTRFSVNGSSEKLRLVIDVPDDDLWTEDHYGTEGLLYKAESTGDYSYRGTDAADYADAFEQKYGDDNMTPLISFLDFINNSTDDEFAENLEDYLDVDEFATYLVMQDLVANDDAIDGPGNNAYLYYDTKTKKMTVVAWDQNLSFGGMGGQGGGGGPMGNMEDMGDKTGFPGADGDEADGERPERPDGEDGEMTPPDGEFEEGQERPEIPSGEDADGENKGGMPGGGGGSMGGKENALVTRFLENDTFSKLVETKKTEYTASIMDNNFAADTLAAYQALLTKEASDLVDEETITSDASTITKYLTGEATTKGNKETTTKTETTDKAEEKETSTSSSSK